MSERCKYATRYMYGQIEQFDEADGRARISQSVISTFGRTFPLDARLAARQACSEASLNALNGRGKPRKPDRRARHRVSWLGGVEQGCRTVRLGIPWTKTERSEGKSFLPPRTETTWPTSTT
eukprot:3743471-Prymnesium_polylepis.1